MRKTKITKRFSLRAKFKGSDSVEVVLMDEFNNIQIELIPIRLGTREVSKSLSQLETGEVTVEPDSKGGKQ